MRCSLALTDTGDSAAAAGLGAEVATLAPNAARAVAAAFAVYFDLINLAEEEHRVRTLRQRERERHPAPIGESVAEAVMLLKSRGVTRGQVAGLLSRLHVELVLTAHPTEAKRRTILGKLQRIAQILRALTGPFLHRSGLCRTLVLLVIGNSAISAPAAATALQCL